MALRAARRAEGSAARWCSLASMTNDDDAPIPMAQGAVPQLPPLPPMVIGEPFVIADGLELLDVPADGRHPGCVLVVRCEGEEAAPCGQPFMIPILSPGVKTCPRCQRQYTYLMVVAPVDDDDIVHDALHQILRANGYPVPDDEGDDEGDEDDDQGDDEPGDAPR